MNPQQTTSRETEIHLKKAKFLWFFLTLIMPVGRITERKF